MDGIFKISTVNKFAKKYGWEKVKDGGIKKLSFIRDSKINGRMRLEVFYTTGTVKTTLTHPKRGKSQAWRYDVSEDVLELLFKNPRHHTLKMGVPIRIRENKKSKKD